MTGVPLYDPRRVTPSCDCDWHEWRVVVGIQSAVGRAVTVHAVARSARRAYEKEVRRVHRGRGR